MQPRRSDALDPVDDLVDRTVLPRLLAQSTRHQAEVGETVDYRIALAARAVHVAAHEALADDVDRRKEEQDAVKDPRATRLLGNLTGGHAWAAKREDADLPVREAAAQRISEFTHCRSTPRTRTLAVIPSKHT